MPLDKGGVRRLFLFWTPASGYDWGHAYHCLEEACPDPNPRDIFFFASELAVRNPIPPIDDADQSDDHMIVGGSASSDVGTGRKRNRKTHDTGDEASRKAKAKKGAGMWGETEICQGRYVNYFAFMTWTGKPKHVDRGGHRLCIHNRRKAHCAECGGNGLCEHQKQKHTCRECKGPSLCQHSRQKSKCKDCGGVGICHHNNDKSRCKLCKLGRK